MVDLESVTIVQVHVRSMPSVESRAWGVPQKEVVIQREANRTVYKPQTASRKVPAPLQTGML